MIPNIMVYCQTSPSTAAYLDDRCVPCSKNRVGKTLGVCKQRRNAFGVETLIFRVMGGGSARMRLGPSGEELT